MSRHGSNDIRRDHNLNELEKLQRAARLIEEMSNGRQVFRTGSVGGPAICPADNANIGVAMRVDRNMQTQRYDISFAAYVRRAGSPMNAAELMALSREVGQTHALLLALEMQKFSPTEEEFRQFTESIRRRQEQESIQSNGPIMGPL